jgi:hypothetical protein
LEVPLKKEACWGESQCGGGKKGSSPASAMAWLPPPWRRRPIISSFISEATSTADICQFAIKSLFNLIFYI